MLLPREIDEIFDACRRGQLDVATASSIPNFEKLREIDGRWIFDVALEHKQRELASWIADSTYDLPLVQKKATLLAAMKSGCADMVKIAMKVLGSPYDYPSLSSVFEYAPKYRQVEIIQVVRSLAKGGEYPVNGLFHTMVTACRQGFTDVVHALVTPQHRNVMMNSSFFLSCMIDTDNNTTSTSSSSSAPAPAPEPEEDLLPVWLLLEAAGCPIDYADPRVWAFTAAHGGIPLLQHITALTPAPAPAALLAGIRAACVHDRAASLALLLGVAGAGAAVAGEKEALLLAALDGGCREAAEVLVTQASVTLDDIQHTNKRKVFFDAIQCGSVLLAEMYIGHRNLDPSRKFHGYDPMAVAGSPEMVRLLLKHGLRTGLRSALSHAAQRLRLDTMRALVAAGATYDAAFGMDWVALAECAEEEVETKCAVLNLLIDLANKPKAEPKPKRSRKRKAEPEAKAEAEAEDQAEPSSAPTETGVSLFTLIDEATSGSPSATAAVHLPATLAVLVARDPRLVEETDAYPGSGRPAATPLMHAVAYDQVPAAAVATLLAAGADVGAWGRAKQHGVFRLLLKPQFGLVPERDPRVVREKLRLLLRAGADPRGAYGGAKGLTVVMGLVCPETYNDVETKIVAEGRTIGELVERTPSGQFEYAGYNRETARFLEDYQAREGPEHSFSDAAGSVFIADIAEGVLNGKLVAGPVRPFGLPAPVKKKQRR
jgi:hypothetical protein